MSAKPKSQKKPTYRKNGGVIEKFRRKGGGSKAPAKRPVKGGKQA